MSRAIENRARRLKNKFSDLVGPRLIYRTLAVDRIAHGRIRFKHGLQLSIGPKLVRALSNCRELVCFIATIGPHIELQAKQLAAKQRLADAFILDAIGSAAVETLVDRFQAEYDMELQDKGKAATYRFSPGYCDWPLNDQQWVFSICAGERINVELTEACLMQPSKSISGLFGIDHSFRDRFNPCLACAKRECAARRETSLERKIA